MKQESAQSDLQREMTKIVGTEKGANLEDTFLRDFGHTSWRAPRCPCWELTSTLLTGASGCRGAQCCLAPCAAETGGEFGGSLSRFSGELNVLGMKSGLFGCASR